MLARHLLSLRQRVASSSAASLPLLGRRMLSATPVARKMVKPPIQLFGLSGRYAHAVFSAASKQKALDQVEKEMAFLKQTVATDEKFANFLKNPILSRATKTDAVSAVAKKQKFSDVTTNFLLTLAENNRLGLTDRIATDFRTIMGAFRNELVCVVKSASPLTKSYQKNLETTLQKFAKKDDKLNVEYQVDPSIRGGLVVDIGDKHIDLSVVRRVNDVIKDLRSASI